ncbi:YycH family regulatory protein [Paenibacillus sediminis]|nr:two-component system activity regulator YycH [Paenibacillus sediminis]
MKELSKSILLLLLVISSLVQSFFLIYRLPGSDSVVKSADKYIKTDNMGAEENVEHLIFPEQMIIHLGENKHTIFYPEMTFYNLIYSRLQSRTFEGFQRKSVHDINWDQLSKDHAGIELKFGSGIPVTLLQKVMQIVPDPLFQAESINRIWIYSNHTENKVHAYFFSSLGDVVYEATKADLTVQDVQQHVDFGAQWTPYTKVSDSYYVPEKPIQLVESDMSIKSYTTEQMQQNLFFDPSITRNIREKDGSEIYTDSKRSLQVRQEQKWMSYTDPAAAPTGESDPSKDVLAAIDFVNQHGGWSGVYRLMLTQSSEDKSSITFQQYYFTYPILDTPSFRYGVMKLEMQQGTVSSYERSLIYVDHEGGERRQAIKLPSGDLLRKLISQKANDAEIDNLYPAYMPSLVKDRLKLTPVWALKLKDGSVRIIAY